MSLRNYLTRNLPAPPPACSFSKSAAAALSQVYENDKLGDCVIAGIAHVVGVLTGNAGPKPFLYTNAQITALYSAIGGYVPGQPSTDRGCDEQTALNYWENNGAPAGSMHKIAGWLSVNGADPSEYRAALWLFENLYFGIELPDKWINPMPSSSGFVWDSAGPADPDNGHCVVGVGYDAKGVTIATWGMTGLITDAAIAKYATTTGQGELYTVVSQDGINKATQKAPNGFDWSQLIADFDSMGGLNPAVVPAAHMALKPRREVRPTLHVIRDVWRDPIARRILGKLSEDDLKTLSDHEKDGSLHDHLATVLDRGGKPSAKIQKIAAKLEPRDLKKASQLYAARGPTCT